MTNYITCFCLSHQHLWWLPLGTTAGIWLPSRKLFMKCLPSGWHDTAPEDLPTLRPLLACRLCLYSPRDGQNQSFWGQNCHCSWKLARKIILFISNTRIV